MNEPLPGSHEPEESNELPQPVEAQLQRDQRFFERLDLALQKHRETLDGLYDEQKTPNYTPEGRQRLLVKYQKLVTCLESFRNFEDNLTQLELDMQRDFEPGECISPRYAKASLYALGYTDEKINKIYDDWFTEDDFNEYRTGSHGVMCMIIISRGDKERYPHPIRSNLHFMDGFAVGEWTEDLLPPAGVGERPELVHDENHFVAARKKYLKMSPAERMLHRKLYERELSVAELERPDLVEKEGISPQDAQEHLAGKGYTSDQLEEIYYGWYKAESHPVGSHPLMSYIIIARGDKKRLIYPIEQTLRHIDNDPHAVWSSRYLPPTK